MTTWVALLRGINVGRNKQVAMSDLRDVVASLGHENVRTHLRSGNVVFTSPRGDGAAIAAELEAALPDRLGLNSRVIVRSEAEFAAIVRDNPLPEAAADPARLHVVFLDAAPKAAEVRRFDAARYAPDVVRFSGREIYVHYPNGFAASKLNDAAWKGLGVTATARNWNTVTKLLALADAAGR
jgi:uncharacterized protein (DUF1697 family)